MRGRVAGVREFETNFETTQERLLRTVAEATSGSVGVLPFGQLLRLIQALVKRQ